MIRIIIVSSDNISGEINFKEFEDQKILKFKAILDNKNENDGTLNLFSDQTEFWANVNPVSSKAYQPSKCSNKLFLLYFEE